MSDRIKFQFTVNKLNNFSNTAVINATLNVLRDHIKEVDGEILDVKVESIASGGWKKKEFVRDKIS